MDGRIYPDLHEMFDAMRAEGIYPTVREGYRTAEEQEKITGTAYEPWHYRYVGGEIAEEIIFQLLKGKKFMRMLISFAALAMIALE